MITLRRVDLKAFFFFDEHFCFANSDVNPLHE